MIEISQMLNVSHPFLFESEDILLMIVIPKKLQCAVTTFVDYIINRVATEDINQLKVKTEQMDEIIEKELKERNVYLNKTNEQSILSFHGKGSMKAKGQLYTPTRSMEFMITFDILDHNLKKQEDVKWRSQYEFEKHRQHGITTDHSGPNQQTWS